MGKENDGKCYEMLNTVLVLLLGPYFAVLKYKEEQIVKQKWH